VKLGPFDISGSYVGDCRELLKQLPDGCVQTCISSPPYWGLRSYLPDDHPDKPREIGQEETPALFVKTMVEIFREVRRTLRDDGTLWLNLGDSYVTNPRGPISQASSNLTNPGRQTVTNQHRECRADRPNTRLKGGDPKNPRKGPGFNDAPNRQAQAGLKNKDLVGIPWMVAFALRDAGWWLRSDIIWSKPNPMPESVTDRPTKAHEYLFLMSKAETYFYDADAFAEPARAWGERDRSGTRAQDASFRAGDPPHRGLTGKARLLTDTTYVPKKNERTPDRRRAGFNARWDRSEEEGTAPEKRNKRSVWTVSTRPYNEAHFAVFPPDLITPCILAGSRPGDVVLDPFFGSGTTGKVAEDNGRLWLGFDLNPAYAELQKKRTAQRGLCFATTKEGP
jgi:DNA modification methylase